MTGSPTDARTPRRVLIAEDEALIRMDLAEMLRDEGYEIVGEAGTGEEAIALAGHLRPDVVLCDLRLGEGLDGIATTARIRALTPTPAVLMLTTFDRDAEILGAI